MAQKQRNHTEKVTKRWNNSIEPKDENHTYSEAQFRRMYTSGKRIKSKKITKLSKTPL